MAKTNEQKIIDNFYNASSARFDEYTFAREMGNQDFITQEAFWKAVMAYIIYKAAIADYTTVSAGSISAMCQTIRNSINSQSATVSGRSNYQL